LLPIDLGKNPVSWIYAWGSETGFFSCHSERSEESHDFLGEVKGLRNRVFPKYFVVTDRFGKKPGFFEFTHGAQKPGFSPVILSEAKNLTISWAKSRGSETGFFRNTSLLPIDSGKNPVS
jgi:hypothetical protein